MNKIVCSLLIFVTATYLAGCGGNTYGGNNTTPVTYKVGGNVSGLASGKSVTLLNNSGSSLTVTADGLFQFTNGVLTGNPYSVTVGTQPAGQLCTSTNNSGIISGSDVSNVVVTCVNAYTVGGNVTGLNGTITLLNNGGDAKVISADGAFGFTIPMVEGSSYTVTIGTPPAGQLCSLTHNSGTNISSNVADIAVTCINSIGGTISGLTNLTGSITLQLNGGNQLTLSANGTFAFSPTPPAGTYAVTIGVLPGGQTCSLNNGSGTFSGTAPVANINVICRTIHAYVVNKTSQTISQFYINNSGVLTPLTPATVSTAIAAPAPVNISIDPSGKFAYVTSDTTNSIAQFSIGNNGTLTPLSPASITTIGIPYGISIDPVGKYAYVSFNNIGTIGQFNISNTGTLAAGTTASVSPNTGPSGISTDPSGRFLYVANHGLSTPYDNTVSQFNINGSTGALAALSPSTVGTGTASAQPYYISIEPAGKYAYVTNGYDNSVAQFSINSSTGALSSLSPSSVATEALPFHITTDPKGKFTYVVNYLGGSVSQYTIGSGGALTAMTQPAVSSGAGTFDISIDPTGRYAYVTNNNSDAVLHYNIDVATGALTSMATASVPAGNFPTTIAIH